MKAYPTTTHLFFSLLALALGFWGQQSPGMRRLCSYSAAILVMIYICSLGGILVFGRIPGKGYFAPGLGFLAGAVIGVVAGIPLGRLGVSNPVVYWILILLVACVIAWLKPLI